MTTEPIQDHAPRVTQRNRVPVSGHSEVVTHEEFATLIASIIETNRTREDLLRAENRILLQIKAICRRLCGGRISEADVLFASLRSLNNEHEDVGLAIGATRDLIPHLDGLHDSRMAVERRLKNLGKKLPIWSNWGESICGFGEMGLAQIVGECGDLSNYDNPAKVWKRLGLAVINGERQQKKSGSAALEHGYSPRRRSIMWNIGNALIKQQNRYRELYLRRKEYERERAEAEGKQVLPASKIKTSEKDQCMSEGHVHNRAKRYMEKRLLRDLWLAWNADPVN